ncbi:putative acetyltransferase [Thermoplasmatales archaeon]|nr:putative acetyltransferase [Thermoplasmatales archaeon]
MKTVISLLLGLTSFPTRGSEVTMKIRKLTEDDAEAVREVAVASWNSTYKEIYDSEYIEQWLSDHYSIEGIKKDIRKSLNDDGLLFLGAFSDSVCIGFIECKFSGAEAELLRLYLIPEKVGQGNGKDLLQYAENFLWRHNVKKCFLEVNCKNTRAISFYESFGFRITGTKDEQYSMVKAY